MLRTEIPVRAAKLRQATRLLFLLITSPQGGLIQFCRPVTCACYSKVCQTGIIKGVRATGSSKVQVNQRSLG